jgi:hypothetical protein
LAEHDARSGAERWGFSVAFKAEELMLSYPTTIMVWTKV